VGDGADIEVRNVTQLGGLLDGIWELAPRIKARQVSPVEVTAAAIAQAERMQPIVNSFITLVPELALQQAHELERLLMSGEYLGPLHGIPIGVKDAFLTAGIRTTDGSKMLEHYVPGHDAGVVERLRNAGAVILGKENMHELAFGLTSDNPWFGRVRNPWDLTRIAGGSSGGSAANVASFVTYASVGSDGGGSIRVPSAACGVVGLKPTFGRVTMRGACEGPDPSTYHVGPHTRSVRDSALMLSAIAGRDPQDPTTVPVPVPDYAAQLGGDVDTLVMGIPTNYFFSPIDAEVEQAVLAAVSALEGLGIRARRVEVPRMDLVGTIMPVIDVPYCTPYEKALRESPEQFSDEVRLMLLSAQFVLAGDFVRCQQLRRLLQREFAAMMRGIDFLVTPTMPILPWAFGSRHVRLGDVEIDISTPVDAGRGKILARNTCVANLLGAPAISVPCGYSRSGLPIGLQIIGRPWEDGLVLRVAHQYERIRSLPPAVPAAVGDMSGRRDLTGNTNAQALLQGGHGNAFACDTGDVATPGG
jgi:aspartyl-tRNA(Asn)/glutamyl-tRNA(Gln) amidotransferase subunit A